MDSYIGRLLLGRMRPLRNAALSIQRSDLLSSLTQHKETHLIIIHAPAGYGKTSLLTQYYELLQTQLEHCAWLSLDKSDDDPVQFLAYLIASLETTGLIPKDILEAAFNGFHGLEVDETLNLVLNSISSFQSPVYFLLDDYHLLPQGDIQQLVQKLIESTFENTHFVITSRVSPVALKGRLQISRSYFELTTNELALTRKETYDVLDLSEKINITEEMASLLHEKTEGWVAAIEFTKTWLNKDLEIDISSFLNQSTDFSTFIMTEIFNHLPIAMQETMLNTSIVNEFNGDLINVICKRDDGWTILNDLYQRDLIIPVDETHTWYRHHPLLADFLLDRFQREGRLNLEDLHQIATGWYLERSNTGDALRHALASGNPDLIASVTERSGGWHFILDGRISTLISILDLLPIEIIQRYPSTYLGHILLNAKYGNVAEATVEFSAFRNSTHNFTILNESSLSPSFAIEANVVDFFLSALSDKPQSPQYVARMETVLKGIDKKDHFLQAVMLNFLVYGYFDMGSFEKAYKAGEEAIFHYKMLHSIYGENFLYFHLGKICLAQGRLRDAEQLYNEGYQLAVDNFGIDSDIAAIAAAHIAEIAYEKNDFEQAQAYLDIALPKIEQSEAWFDVYYSAYLTAANIARVQKNTASALKILSNASLTGKRRDIRRLRIYSICKRIQILIQEGKLLKAGWITQTLQLDTFISTSPEIEFVSHRLIEQTGSTLAYYQMNSENPGKAIKIIDVLLITAKRNNCRRSLISLFILLSLAYFKLGKHKQALARLNDAVSHAMFEGFKRPFLEYGNDQKELMEMAISNDQLFPLNRLKRSFLVDLIGLLNQESKYREHQSPNLLTTREREIVKYIYEGCSNKEIARSCNCSENTVKFHLKNIFSKLKVKNRKALARMAWEHSL